MGNINIQIVSSGPDCRWDNIQYNYFKMISQAKKSIFIATPYFVPDDSLLVALKTASLSGVDVRVMIPAKPDHPLVYYGSINYMGELMEAGVKCYEYEKGFIHSKLMCVDGVITSVGTANMDIRSFKLNFEVNAFIYDVDVTREFENQFYVDFEDSRELTLEAYKNKGRITRFKEALARIISQLL